MEKNLAITYELAKAQQKQLKKIELEIEEIKKLEKEISGMLTLISIQLGIILLILTISG